MAHYVDEISVQDGFRAQFFLSSIEKELRKIEDAVSDLMIFSRTIQEVLQEFSDSLATELDRIFLPTVVFELEKAKRNGDLSGNSATARYESFFVDGNKYTKHTYSILEKYPFLFELSENLIVQTFDSLLRSLRRYKENELELKKWNQFPPNILIHKIKPLDGADRHSSQQTLLFEFSNGLKVIYKPVDLRPDLLLARFIEKLELQDPFNLKSLEVFALPEYGWIKFIDFEKCENTQEIEDFYCRTGVLLAVADSLNYTDGHCENLFAKRAFPILIDGETLFQNYEPPVIDDKSILTTLLIQKINDQDENRFLNSALQAPDGIKYEYLKTHAIHDQTDDIEVRYQGINDSPHHHCPWLNDESCPAHKYVSFIIKGYCYGYRKITEKLDSIVNDKNWWRAVGKVRGRVLLRETISYVYLLRNIQLPEQLVARKKAESILLQKLGSTCYSQYEADDLLSLNIPYFYQIPRKKHLYDSKGYKYPNVFGETAIARLKKQFLQRSDKKMNFGCDILSRHLVPPFMEELEMSSI